MKKAIKTIISAAIMLAIMCCMCACGKKEDSGDILVRYFVDEQTGVNYVLYNGEAITPRLNTDGTLYRSEVE